jgi:signal transduction histidine kinase
MSVVRQTAAAGPTPLRLRGAISRARVERILTRAAAIFALVFALQTIPAVSASSVYLHDGFALALALVLFGLLFVVMVLAALNRGGPHPAKVAMGIFTVVYTVALALWPAGLLHGPTVVADQPWLWYLITISMIFAVIAFSPRWAVLYIVDITAIYVFIRTQPAGGAAPLALALLDGFYVVLLGAFALATITSIRVAAVRVDAAQSTAMEQYARVARNHAAELERSRVDALVHDTVLSTLIAAARAETEADRRAVVEMSAQALQTLQEAPVAFDPEREVAATQLADRLADAARLPGPVAEAVFTAAQQALINSLQHAGVGGGEGGATGAGAAGVAGAAGAAGSVGAAGSGEDERDVARTVVVHCDAESGLTVQVADTGCGFDVREIPHARLGLRVSIRERMEAVGGSVRVLSVPGGGTSVVIEWRPAS